MKEYVVKSSKSEPVQKIINEALEILDLVGIPLLGKTDRAKERIAMSYLAVAGISTDWEQAKNNINVKTRDVINFVNKYFEENISSGSYDDIQRKDLKLLVLADLNTPEPEILEGIQEIEFDEMWHFVKKKDNKLWGIKAFDHCSRRTVGWTLGGRQETTRLQHSGDGTAK